MSSLRLIILLLAGLFGGTVGPFAALASSPKVTLSQRKVAELVITQSDYSKETNLRADLPRFDYATALSGYDWTLTAETGYELSKFENFSQTHNAKDQALRSSLLLAKPWTTGTKTTFEWTRASLQSEYFPSSQASTTLPTRQTQDIFGVTIEQSLWRNTFGKSDRAKVRSAQSNLDAALVTRADDLQNNVLEGLRKYWNAYVAEETFKESMASRDRYRKLADNVKRKSSFGFSSPGEFSQIRAELEAREQNTKLESTNYLNTLEDLLIYLNIPQASSVEFQVEKQVPNPPNLPEKKASELRAHRAQDLKFQAAQELVTSAQSNRNPTLSLVGKLYSSGIEEAANDSLAEAFSGGKPKYYVGLKFEVPFGSDIRNEELANKQILAQLEGIKRRRNLETLESRLAHRQRRVLATHAIAKSLEIEKSHREKAMQEINRAYTQGRIDIRNLIESMNLYFTTNIKYSRAVGDYQIALAELAAVRDELIPSPKEGEL